MIKRHYWAGSDIYIQGTRKEKRIFTDYIHIKHQDNDLFDIQDWISLSFLHASRQVSGQKEHEGLYLEALISFSKGLGINKEKRVDFERYLTETSSQFVPFRLNGILTRSILQRQSIVTCSNPHSGLLEGDPWGEDDERYSQEDFKYRENAQSTLRFHLKHSKLLTEGIKVIDKEISDIFRLNSTASISYKELLNNYQYKIKDQDA